MRRFIFAAVAACLLTAAVRGRISVIARAQPEAVRAPQPPPAFRASADLIAVDVQVVDKDGQPILDLTPADFQVSFNGKPRRVVSADLTRYNQPAPAAGPTRAEAPSAPVTPAPVTTATPPSAGSRYIILAIDNTTFSAAESRGAAQAAQGFVDRLAPADEVGLYTYPLGPRLDPTTDRAAVRAALSHVMGERNPPGGQFTLSPSDIVDVSAGDGGATFQRLCGTAPTSSGRPGSGMDPSACSSPTCPAQVTCEVQKQVIAGEGQLNASLGTLGALMRTLGGVAGRKIVVLVSAGTVVSDRPDGRPDIGTLSTALGRQAAQSDVTLYTLFLDQGLLEQGAAENAHGLGGSTHGRDSALVSHWLDLFAGSAGGTMLTDLIGSGEEPYNRILRETSAYYLLGVEPEAKDRDGQTHALTVKVNRRGVTVRSRAWAVVPKPGESTALRVPTAAALSPTRPSSSAVASPRSAAASSRASLTPAMSARLSAWLTAVNAHVPGQADASVRLVAGWSLDDLDNALWALRATAKASASTAADWNRILKRGALLHTDVAMANKTSTGYALPSDGSRLTVVEDGRAVGKTTGTFHWQFARTLIDALVPSPGDDQVRLWYRATSAYLQETNDVAELRPHLFRARQLFPDDAVLILDAGTMEEGSVAPQFAQAESLFRDALRNEPALVEARIRLAHVLGAQGNYAEAVTELDRALATTLPAPFHYDALVLLGADDLALDRLDAARRAATEADALFPGAQSARLLLSQLDSEAGDRAGAVRALSVLHDHGPAAARVDPWPSYRRSHMTDASELLAELHRLTF